MKLFDDEWTQRARKFNELFQRNPFSHRCGTLFDLIWIPIEMLVMSEPSHGGNKWSRDVRWRHLRRTDYLIDNYLLGEIHPYFCFHKQEFIEASGREAWDEFIEDLDHGFRIVDERVASRDPARWRWVLSPIIGERNGRDYADVRLKLFGELAAVDAPDFTYKLSRLEEYNLSNLGGVDQWINLELKLREGMADVAEEKFPGDTIFQGVNRVFGGLDSKGVVDRLVASKQWAVQSLGMECTEYLGQSEFDSAIDGARVRLKGVIR